MKKTKIELNKKLILNKEMIGTLEVKQQLAVIGGGTEINCQTAFNTCPYTLCVGCTQTQAAQTQPCGQFACQTIAC